MSTKLNPGRYDCFAKLADDEPYFVLRAKDPDAPAIIEAWTQMRARRSGNARNPKIGEALACAAAMRAWRLREMSGKPCGCDPGAKYICARHRAEGD